MGKRTWVTVAGVLLLMVALLDAAEQGAEANAKADQAKGKADANGEGSPPGPLSFDPAGFLDQRQLPDGAMEALKDYRQRAAVLRHRFERKLAAQQKVLLRRLHRSRTKAQNLGNSAGAETVGKAIGALEPIVKQVAEAGQEDNRDKEARPPMRPLRPKALGYRQGLVVWEYPLHKSQQKDGGAFVKPENLGEPVAQPRRVKTVSPLEYNEDRNAVASGYLKIEKAGTYAFRTSSSYDRNALYVNGKLVCPYQDGDQTVQEIELSRGMVPFRLVGAVKARGSASVDWRPPEARELKQIPEDVLYFRPLKRKP